MKRSVFILLALLAWTGLFGQIKLSQTTLNFPETGYGDSEVLKLTVQNLSGNKEAVRFVSHNADFKLSTSSQAIEGNGSYVLEVTFSPRHNINYNSELVVYIDYANGKPGAESVDLRGKGKYSDYYNTSTFDLYNEDLKAALKSTISKNYKNLGYNGARDAMYGSIDNHNGKVTCVYTGRTATFNTRTGANSNSFNCEHTWPQSLFNKNEPERADIHHLFPTDANANGKRGNYPFGEVASATWSEGGSKLGSGIFEPRDEHKGDVARAMFYFATRYQNYSSFLTNQEKVLREWEALHPPTQMSRDRNEAIFTYQKNRNPFVDYPEFLERIRSISTTSVEPKVYSVVPYPNVVATYKVEDTTVINLVLTNIGNQTVTFDSVEYASSEIKILDKNITVLPGESANVRVGFNKTTYWLYDTLKFVSDQTTASVALKVGIISTGNKPADNPVKIWNNGEQLRVSNALNSTCRIVSSNGQQVAFTEIQSDFTEINLTHLPSGVYFVYVESVRASGVVKKILIP